MPAIAIEDPRNTVFISAASVWEIAIKRRLGKLAFQGSACSAIGANGFQELPVVPLDAEDAGDLGWHNASLRLKLGFAVGGRQAESSARSVAAARGRGGNMTRAQRRDDAAWLQTCSFGETNSPPSARHPGGIGIQRKYFQEFAVDGMTDPSIYETHNLHGHNDPLAENFRSGPKHEA
jgi:hypothetical protein